MRSILNISLPKEVAAEVRRAAKEGGFVSTSEFMRHVLREYRRAKLAQSLKRERARYLKNPKAWKVLRSLKDLR